MLPKSEASQTAEFSNNLDFGGFDFDYELLDKLLGVQETDHLPSHVVVAPVPSYSEGRKTNQLETTDWIKQLESDLENFGEDEVLSQSPSNFDSVRSSTDEVFDPEWAELSRILAISSPLPSQTPFSYQDFGESMDYFSSAENSTTSESLSLNRELQNQVRALIGKTKSYENQQKDLERVIELINTQIARKMKRKSMPIWSYDAITLSKLDSIVEEARGASTEIQQSPNLVKVNSRLKEYMRLVKLQARWTVKERHALFRGVRSQNEKILVNLIKERGNVTEEECKNIIANVHELDFLMNVNGLDWEKISKYFVQTRNAADCRLQWTINDHPMINQSPLLENNDAEIENLRSIVPKSMKLIKSKGLPENFCNTWQFIASQLGTNRTAIQCFMMYQRRVNPDFLKGKWTPEEDAQLIAAVKQFGSQDWQGVSQCLDGRTGQQCLHRYDKAINPEIKRGRWTVEEDGILKQAVLSYINDNNNKKIIWATIKQLVPGRTDVQCRERWVNVLDPNLTAAPFSPAEDEHLRQLITKYGLGNWSKISLEMGKKRTDNQCWRRWKQLLSIQKKNGSKRMTGKTKK